MAYIVTDKYKHPIKSFHTKNEARCFIEVMGRYDWDIKESYYGTKRTSIKGY